MFGATVGSFFTAACACLRPTSAPRYVAVYPFATPGMMLRSIAYLTSLDVTSRLTGGLNFTPLLRWKVTVLPSSRHIRRAIGQVRRRLRVRGLPAHQAPLRGLVHL